MKFKPVKVLYFVDGTAPTPEDLIAAGALNAQVCFRNARAVPAEGCLEDCDGVAGCAPLRYSDAYPSAEAAIEKRAAELAALASKVGDSPAPVAPVAKVADAAVTPAQADAGAGDSAAKDDAKTPAPGAAVTPAKAWTAN